jgi:hypothetical protein
MRGSGAKPAVRVERFTQEDPSGQSAGHLYVGDNPVNGTDPAGACVLDLFGSGCPSIVHALFGSPKCIAQSAVIGGTTGVGTGVVGTPLVGAVAGFFALAGTDIVCQYLS